MKVKNNIKKVFLSWFILFLIKKSGGRGVPPLVNIIPVNGDFNQNERPLIDLAMQQLLEQLH